jgi:hypothetical protein
MILNFKDGITPEIAAVANLGMDIVGFQNKRLNSGYKF